MARRSLVILAGTAAALIASGSASAHGPCGCTFPAVAEPGQQIRTGRAYKIIWNPAPRDFQDQTTPEDLASGFRVDAPTAVVLQRSPKRPLRRAAFRVPQRTPPGIYFVLVFDGSEGGAHTTWDYVQVRSRRKTQEARARTPPAERPADGAGGPPIVLGTGAVALLVVAGLAVLRRRRRPGAQ